MIAQSTVVVADSGRSGGQVSTALDITPTSTLAIFDVITATLHTLTPIYIRTGPGLDYPVLGTFAVDAEAIIVGRSFNGEWWKIVCPRELNHTDCWVTANIEYVRANHTQAVSLATALPAPSPTPEPSATPCVATPPPGWSLYTVRFGDTLSELATLGGVSISEIQTVNCFTELIADREIYVPATPAGISASTSASAPPSTAPTRQEVPRAALAATLGFGSPNRSRSCKCTPPSSATQKVIIGARSDRIWEVGHTIPICGGGFEPGGTVQLAINDGSGVVEMQTIESDLNGQWKTAWVIPATARTGLTYTLSVVAQPQPLTAPFMVVPLATPKIILEENEATIGTPVVAHLRGFAPGFNAGLYAIRPFTVTTPTGEAVDFRWELVHEFVQLPTLNQYGWGTLIIQTSALSAEKHIVWGTGMSPLIYSDCQVLQTR